MKIACLMMQKDEGDLLEPWLQYYSALFGSESLYLWDNASTESNVCATLQNWQSRLGGLRLDLVTPADFRRKGVILGDKIKELDKNLSYDYYIPLDCDEFIGVIKCDGVISFEREDIFSEFEKFTSETRVLGVDTAFYNLPGRPDLYWKSGYQKSIFRAGTFKVMDHGFHEGLSKLSEGRASTKLVYMHLHHKPHTQIVEHSRNKVAPYFNVQDEALMKSLYATNRLVRFMLDDEKTYLDKFLTMGGVDVSAFRVKLEGLGVSMPW